MLRFNSIKRVDFQGMNVRGFRGFSEKPRNFFRKIFCAPYFISFFGPHL